ncbi:hypothetical protein CFC21_030408 [Triticum aestivum]|uniref:HMA domain-containing protein n=3 Tax=Triticinae TaxID=1648030 RepID=A0A453C6E7_AEGTS|nr:disease resistance protein RGA5 [Aegilops tauschii subsp. strangulata]XP_044328326.1 disease resistance protein RGA5-like [Triticum aestivum]KAF7016889.1 hypothetical protein CFC21_030408 [Triticum aestivum]
MRTEMVIRIQIGSEKGHSKAIKVAAAVTGVESVTIAGEDKNLLLVIGAGVDSNRLTEKLRRKVGHAEVVELRTVDDDDFAGEYHPYRYHPSPSPYKHVTARDMYYTGSYPPQQHAGGGRDHYRNAGSYPPTTGGRDYYSYGGGGGGGGYPAQYQQQGYYYPQQSAANMHTVVHHGYSDDPNSCSIM